MSKEVFVEDSCSDFHAKRKRWKGGGEVKASGKREEMSDGARPEGM